MQTFMPSKWYTETARVLDNKRLHKQALEAWQILMVLTELDPEGNDRTPKGWANHPAVKMWRGNESELHLYICCMVNEWESRGFKSTIKTKATNTLWAASLKNRAEFMSTGNKPDWIKDEDLLDKITASHRMALLSKNYEWYSQFNWPEDTGQPITEYQYVWPV